MGKTSPTKIQAKHIPVGMLIDLVHHLSGAPKVYTIRGAIEGYYPSGPSLYDICRYWDTVPPKVIQAKLRKLIEKYGVLEGCSCGCSSSITLSKHTLYKVVRTYDYKNQTFIDRLERI
jgi:hypothetical protein